MGLSGLVTLGVVAVTILALAILPTLPSIDDLSETRLNVPLRVYTADGLLLAEFGEEKRIPTKIEEVPEQLVQAILAAEDRNFLYHRGVDVVGLIRATIANLRSGSTGQGGSTITMQVARNYFLSPEKTYTRKLKEILLAFKLERELSKKQILELYVNKIFLGHRAYGFAAAARIYYGKTLDELTLDENAMLAGLPKAPSKNNPLTNPESAIERRNYVLRQMRGLDFIDQTAFETASASVLTASRHSIRYDIDAPYLAEMVRQELFKSYDEKVYAGGFNVYTTIDSRHQAAANRALASGVMAYERRHGYRGATAHTNLRGAPDRERLDELLKDYRAVGPLEPGIVLKVADKSASVYMQDGTTVTVEWEGLSWARRYQGEDAIGPAPKSAAEVVKVGDLVYLERREPAPANENSAEIVGGWWLAQVPQVSAAFVALRSDTGAVLALSGGFDFRSSSFNRAVQAERQAGSSIKPFIWAAALDKGFTPASAVSGAPIVVDGADQEEEWRPEDYGKKFHGPTRLRKALAISLNLVSIRLLRAIGADYSAQYLHERFGFDETKLPRNLSLALGTASVTPMQMTGAYAVFASGGFRVEPYFITRIEDADGKLLFRASPTLACDACVPTATETADPLNPPPRMAPRTLTPETAFLMTSMMRSVVNEGTGSAARVLGRRDLAGKTGTTNEYRDAWFCGFNSDVVAAAWVGFDQPTPLGRGETGGRAALPIWIDYMREALKDVPEKPLTPPTNIVRALVNRDTGEPTDTSDPLAMEEYFVRGTETGAGPALANDPDSVGETSAPNPKETENVREDLF